MKVTANQKPDFNSQTVNLLLSVLLFIPPAITVFTYRYLRLDYSITAWIQYCWILGIILGAVIGWLNGFPRWVYPYIFIVVALMIVFSIGSDSDMTLQENLVFKSIVLGPVLLFFALVWFFFRKKHLLSQFFSNMRKDWTLASFGIYGLMTIVISGIFTDIRSVYGAPFLVMATLVLIMGACSYILVEPTDLRYIILATGLTVAWLIAGLGSATFWNGRQAAWMVLPANGLQLAGQYTLMWLVMVILILLPLLVAAIRRRHGKKHTGVIRISVKRGKLASPGCNTSTLDRASDAAAKL